MVVTEKAFGWTNISLTGSTTLTWTSTTFGPKVTLWVYKPATVVLLTTKFLAAKETTSSFDVGRAAAPVGTVFSTFNSTVLPLAGNTFSSSKVKV